VLKKLLSGPIVFTPHRHATERFYSFRVSVNLGKLLAGIACAKMVASPTGARDTYEAGTEEAYELPLTGTVRKAA